MFDVMQLGLQQVISKAKIISQRTGPVEFAEQLPEPADPSRSAEWSQAQASKHWMHASSKIGSRNFQFEPSLRT